MTKRQLYSLFLCSLVAWAAGNGLVPLLPVYARQLGADPATAGYYLAFSYAALAVGAVAAGWVSDRLQRRKVPLIVASLAAMPIVWLMGRVESVWALSVLTAMVWFLGGLALALVSILTGLSAGEEERGKIFGILSLTSGLGAFIGSLATGYIADEWGFPAMFSSVALFFVVSPLAGIFVTDIEVKRVEGRERPGKPRSTLGRSYRLLFAASLLASVASFIIVFSRSLLMSDQGFGAMAIASTGALGGLVAMPIPLLVGWLSDRAGRKAFLGLGYLSGIVSLSVLALSTSLWHFYIVLVLQAILFAVNAAVGSAFVTDLVPPESLGRGLSLFGATSWIGGVFGFAGAGYALQSLGAAPTVIIGICLALTAIVLLLPIRSGVREQGAIALGD